MWMARAFSLRDDELVDERPLPMVSEQDVALAVGEEVPLLGVAHVVPAATVASLLGEQELASEDVEWSLEFDASAVAVADAPRSSPRGLEAVPPGDQEAAGARSWPHFDLPYPEDRNHYEALRERLGDPLLPVLMVIGSGLSIGACRRPAHRSAGGLSDSWLAREDPADAPLSALVGGMADTLLGRTQDPHERESLSRFLRHSSYLDAAELFRHRVEEPEYVAFLRREFEVPGSYHVPAVHRALVRLPVSHFVTTNYDTLIERAFESESRPVVVSRDLEEFRASLGAGASPHLLKLHGSIERPESMVFTRSQFVAARLTRLALLAALAARTHFSALLFLGFTRDEMSVGALQEDFLTATGGVPPPSYLVQSTPDPAVRSYLESMNVRTITLSRPEDAPSVLDQLAA